MNKILVIAVAIFLSHSACAETIGAWQLYKKNDIQIAKTFNQAGSTAGVLCVVSTRDCQAYISADNACEENSRYPLMVNSSVGASNLSSTCKTIGGVQYHFIDEFQSAVNAFESGGEFGFAMPLKSGKFVVLRFESAGATAVIREARRPPAAPVKPASTSNQTL